MIDKVEKLNKRQEFILQNIDQEREYALRDLALLFKDEVKQTSLATLRRDVSKLSFLGFLTKKGKLKSTTYKLSIFGMLNTPIDAHAYCSVEPDKRKANTRYNFSLFSELPDELLPEKTVASLEGATKSFKEKSQGASETIKKKELERFVIELSWKSSKIEGNTYTLLDTELLIKKGIEAPGHTKDETIMILNHKKAFQYILDSKQKIPKNKRAARRRCAQAIGRRPQCVIRSAIQVGRDNGVNIHSAFYTDPDTRSFERSMRSH